MQVSHSPKSHPAFRSVLVLCEGNHCRSPIAEILLKASLGDAVQVESAGLGALVGSPADPEAQRLMTGLGLDLSGHRGRQVTAAMLLAADLVLVMDRRQKDWCEELAPSTRGRVFLLGHWLSPQEQEIQDPFRQGPVAMQKALDVINQSIVSWLPHMASTLRSA